MKVGILGGGQLGRMLALDGYPLGLRFRFFDRSAKATAGMLGDMVAGEYEDTDALDRFADGLDVITYEFENVPVAAARALAERAPVRPAPRALEVAQDRLTEKTFFRDLGIGTAPFEPVSSRDELDDALDRIGAPAVLKTRRFGYDGKGQYVIRSEADAMDAWDALGGRPLLLEGFVDFRRELSILAVRGLDGTTAFYPLVENHHHQGILSRSLAPAPDLPPVLQRRAEAYATRALEALDYVGVLAIEFFHTGDDLIANEMAPRVHNSGHWTIEGAEASQFENHLRAVIGAPLGPPSMVGWAGMQNLIGRVPDRSAVLGVPGAHLHLYDKSARPGRKLGHVTVRADDPDTLRERMDRLHDRIGDPVVL